ncbi:hypothetical protein BAUCODRAFT_44490, partial [Baudoinia panamericana UAMH 10762]
EYQWLNFQHEAIRQIMHGTLIHSRIQSPRKILDIGCGTGAVSVHLAERFPNAEVVGIDISPVPDVHARPSNLSYRQGNILDLPGEWNFIFSRLLLAGMHDWPRYVGTMYRLLSPGEWAELQDVSVCVFDAQENDISADWKYMIATMQSIGKLGMDGRIGIHLPEYVRDCGFIEIQIKHFPWVL